jgi:hypothetical protein
MKISIKILTQKKESPPFHNLIYTYGENHIKYKCDAPWVVIISLMAKFKHQPRDVPHTSAQSPLLL